MTGRSIGGSGRRGGKALHEIKGVKVCGVPVGTTGLSDVTARLRREMVKAGRFKSGLLDEGLAELADAQRRAAAASEKIARAREESAA